MNNFWTTLPKPFFALAPMADVTDAAFRRIITKYGKPDIFWTEFVSSDGLVLAPEEGREKLLKDLEYTEDERPIVAQLFTSKPENIEKAVCLAKELGFDGVDINMGCPDRSIEKQGAGAAHIKDLENAKEVIAAAREGAGDIPVSVKTRLGYNKNEIDTWIKSLLELNLPALTVHARTRKEMSKVPARWEDVKEIVRMRNEVAPKTLIIGNGDVVDIEDGRRRVNDSGADGAMLGRAIFGNPWLFSEQTPTFQEKLTVMVEHTKLFEELLPHKNFAVMKKHYKAYVNGFAGAAELRQKLMETNSAGEVQEIVEKFLVSYT